MFKEIEIGAAPAVGEISSADPELLAVVRMLAERADQAAAEAEKGKQPFIHEGERPEVGEAAVGPLAPPSNPTKSR